MSYLSFLPRVLQLSSGSLEFSDHRTESAGCRTVAQQRDFRPVFGGRVPLLIRNDRKATCENLDERGARQLIVHRIGLMGLKILIGAFRKN